MQVVQARADEEIALDGAAVVVFEWGFEAEVWGEGGPLGFGAGLDVAVVLL